MGYKNVNTGEEVSSYYSTGVRSGGPSTGDGIWVRIDDPPPPPSGPPSRAFVNYGPSGEPSTSIGKLFVGFLRCIAWGGAIIIALALGYLIASKTPP
jgi:hypothetical protein